MKKFAVALVVLVCVLGAIHASGWAPRQMSSPSGRLVGQWIETDAGGLPQFDLGAHWYFAPPGSDGRGELVVSKDGVEEKGSWRVLEDRAAKNQVKLELTRPSGKAVWVITVEPDGAKAKVAAEALVVQLTVSQLAYVDATTSPSVWSLGEVQHRLRRFAGAI